MPLIQGKSDKAFKSNVKSEMHAGKPQGQSLAIAYSIKRRNAAKKMAYGGPVARNQMSEHEMESQDQAMDALKMCAHGGPMSCNSGCYDEGGNVTSKHQYNPKLHASKMADGGVVGLPKDMEGFERSNGKYPKAKRMSDGGEVPDEEDPRGGNLDLDDEEDAFDMENEPSMEEVHNEYDNPMGDSEDESESDEMAHPKKRLLSRVFGAISRAHKGM